MPKQIATEPETKETDLFPAAEAEPEAVETTTPEPEAKPTPDTSVAPTDAQPTESTTTDAAQPVSPSLSGLKDFLAAKHGIDVSQFSDDSVLAETLLQNAREAAHYRQQAMDLEQRMRQAATPPVAPQPAVETKPQTIFDSKPKFDPRWLSLVEKDPITGQLKAKPGAPGGVVKNVEDYLAWRAEWSDKLLDDPEGAIQPLVERMLKESVEQQLSSYRQEQAAAQIVAQNEQWMYAKNPQGGRTLTAAGQRYLQLADEAAQLGIIDPQKQHTYAYRAVAAEAVLRQQQMQPAAAKPVLPKTNADHKQDAINAGAKRQPNAPVNGRTRADTSTNGLSFMDKLNREFVNAGLKEDDFRFGSGE